MRNAILTACIILLTCGGSAAQAETIYSWIDAQGIQHFSDQPPPEGTQNVKISETPTDMPVPPGDPPPDRNAFEQMVERATAESLQLQNEREAKEAAAAAEKDRRAKEESNARTAVELQRLQGEIDEINGRGLSRTFSQGMKDNLINKIQKRIDLLEKDPEAYFREN